MALKDHLADLHQKGKLRLPTDEAGYRANIRGSSNRRVANESKMLDAQHEAEQNVLRSRSRRAVKTVNTSRRRERVVADALSKARPVKAQGPQGGS